MAVAAPKHRSSAATAPAPSRTAPPAPKKRPRDRPSPGGRTAAPARKPRKVQIDAPPRRKPSASRAAAAPARKAPARRKAAPGRRTGARVIPIAAGTAGRAAVAVTQLPESGLIHRLTRGRAWIGLLGVLLVGIVALNVVTLSFAASAGKIDERNQELSKENSAKESQLATKMGQARLRHEAAEQGLTMTPTAEPQLLTARKADVAEAAARLGAAAAAANPE